MTTLKLQPEEAKIVATKMRETYSNMLQDLNILNGLVNNLTSNLWQGSACTQFESIYSTWKSQMATQLEELNATVDSLNAEITEWESADRTFGQ